MTTAMVMLSARNDVSNVARLHLPDCSVTIVPLFVGYLIDCVAPKRQSEPLPASS